MNYLVVFDGIIAFVGGIYDVARLVFLIVCFFALSRIREDRERYF